MAIVPQYFDGRKFMAKYGITDPHSFRINAANELVCLAFPNLTDADLLDCVETQAERNAVDAALLRSKGAISEAKLATELKSLTPQQAVDWINTNVTTLTSAKTVLKIMARLLIAMRNKVFPELPDS